MRDIEVIHTPEHATTQALVVGRNLTGNRAFA
jgi:hypothetical protein